MKCERCGKELDQRDFVPEKNMWRCWNCGTTKTKESCVKMLWNKEQFLVIKPNGIYVELNFQVASQEFLDNYNWAPIDSIMVNGVTVVDFKDEKLSIDVYPPEKTEEVVKFFKNLYLKNLHEDVEYTDD